jgi:carbon storage regulator
MLVLSRKRGERIVIGTDVTVTVLEVRGDRVRLGFDAPVEVPVHREEVCRGIKDGPPVVSYAECV